MQRLMVTACAGISLAAALATARAADLGGPLGCTGPACTSSVPACRATWEDKKSATPAYSMTCEHACARGRDSWHAPSPECRSRPPRGAVYVQKRLYKVDGEERVERVPKYEATLLPAEPCDCAACRGAGRLCWLNPFALFQ